MTDVMQIDCTIMNYQSQNYIVPTAIFVEFSLLVDSPRIIQTKQNEEEKRVHAISWKNFVLPLVDMSLSQRILPFPKNSKIAVVHALYSKESHYPPYFALCFETVPYRQKVSAKTIEWMDDELKIAKVTSKGTEVKVRIFDLLKFSKKLEKILNEMKNLT